MRVNDGLFRAVVDRPNADIDGPRRCCSAAFAKGQKGFLLYYEWGSTRASSELLCGGIQSVGGIGKR